MHWSRSAGDEFRMLDGSPQQRDRPAGSHCPRARPGTMIPPGPSLTGQQISDLGHHRRRNEQRPPGEMHAGEQLHTRVVIVIGGERRRDQRAGVADDHVGRPKPSSSNSYDRAATSTRRAWPTPKNASGHGRSPPIRGDDEPQPAAEARPAQSPRLGTVPALSTGAAHRQVSGQHRPEPRSRSNLDVPAASRTTPPCRLRATSKLWTAPGGVRPVRSFDA